MSMKYKHILNALVLAFFFVLPFEHLPTIEVANFTVKISYILGVAIIFTVLLNYKKNILEHRLDLGDWSLVALFVCAALSLNRSQDFRRGLLTFLMWGFVFFLYFILFEYLKNQDRREKVEKYLLLSTFFICIFGLYQFIAGSLDVPVQYTGLRLRYAKEVLGFPRVQSVALEPLYFANFLLVPFFLTIKKYLFEKSKVNVYFWLLILILSNIILTVSRGAYLSLVISMATFLIYFMVTQQKYRQKIWLIMAAGAISVVVSLLLFVSLNGLDQFKAFGQHVVVNDSTNRVSVEGRQEGYLSAIDKFKTSPLFGMGITNSGVLSEPMIDHGEVLTYGSLNNIYLEILSELGLVGFLFFMFFLVYLIWILFKRLSSLRGHRKISIILLSLGLFAIFIQYNFFSTLYIIYIWVFLALLKGEVIDEEN